MRAIPFPLVPRWVRYLSVVAVAGVLLYFSVLSPPPVAPPDPGPFWDKQLHLLSYGGFTLALAYATVHLRARPWRRVTLVVLTAIGYGVAIELIQGMQPERFASTGDALANLLGTVLACAWFWIEPRLRYVRLLSGESIR